MISGGATRTVRWQAGRKQLLANIQWRKSAQLQSVLLIRTTNGYEGVVLNDGKGGRYVWNLVR